MLLLKHTLTKRIVGQTAGHGAHTTGLGLLLVVIGGYGFSFRSPSPPLILPNLYSCGGITQGETREVTKRDGTTETK